MESNSEKFVEEVRRMTNKDFVLSIYPRAYFSRGSVYADDRNGKSLLWEDEYGAWAEEWIDDVAINYAWEQEAKIINRKILKKLEQ